MVVPPDMSISRTVELVRASNSVPVPAAMRDDAMIVSLSASGDPYFASKRAMPNELEGKIRGSLTRGAEKRIYLTVDSRARYGDLKSVLPQIASAGVENVTFISR